jgi:prepilin-type N-terminal cleavage/methylation domain-containing protein
MLGYFGGDWSAADRTVPQQNLCYILRFDEMKPIRFVKTGFTLTELLVATAVSLILCGVAFTGLVTFQQMSQQTDERLVQEAELQRALHLMATDIQEGKRIEAGAAPVSGYSPIFKSIRSDGSTISYYSADRGSKVWAGPKILYRWDSREGRSYALVDKLAIVDGVTVSASDVCTGSGTLVGRLGLCCGLRIRIRLRFVY